MRHGIHKFRLHRIAALKVIYLFLGILICYLIFELRTIVICFLMAITLASAMAPVAEWGDTRKIPRVVTVIGIYIAIALLYSGVAYLLYPPMKEQAVSLYEHLPKIVQDLTVKFPMLTEYVGSDGDVMKIDPQHLQEIGPSFAKKTLSLTAGLMGALANVVLILFLTSYFVVEAKDIWSKLLLWVPKQNRARAGNLIKPLETRMGGYVRGQVLVSIAVATVVGGGLTLLGVKYSLVLGALAGLFNLVPFVGSAIAMSLSLLVAFNQDPTLAIFVLVLFGIEQWLESSFIVPQLLGRQVELHPLIVLFSILIGATLIGLPGALIAVPVAAALQLLAIEFYLNPLNNDDPVTADGMQAADFAAIEPKTEDA